MPVVRVFEVIQNGDLLNVLGTVDGVGHRLTLSATVIADAVADGDKRLVIAQALLTESERTFAVRLDRLLGELNLDAVTREPIP